MTNTQESVNEARALADQLIDKTQSKKLAWIPTSEYPNDFHVTIDGGFGFTIYESMDDGFGISMVDRDGVELLRAEVESNPKYGYSLSGEQALSITLRRLHELARRQVLDVDRKVNEARSLLQRL